MWILLQVNDPFGSSCVPELPVVTGAQCIRAFEKVGFSVDRIRGSHHVMVKPGHRFVLTVPVHGRRALAKGTLKALIRAAAMSIADFVELLD